MMRKFLISVIANFSISGVVNLIFLKLDFKVFITFYIISIIFHLVFLATKAEPLIDVLYIPYVISMVSMSIYKTFFALETDPRAMSIVGVFTVIIVREIISKRKHEIEG